MRWIAASVGHLSVLAGTTLAHAQAAADAHEGNAATALALFEEARGLMKQQRYPEACAKFEQSLRIQDGAGTQFNLGVCYETIGKNASALAAYTRAATMTRLAGQPEREREAQKRAEALEPKLSRLKINVSRPIGGLTVHRDDVRVDPAQFGTAVPVDPATIVVRAAAPGRVPWSSEVVVDGPGTFTTTVPPLQVEGLASQSAPKPEPEPPLQPPDGGEAYRIAGVALGVVGVAGLAVGVGFGVDALNKKSEAEPHCPVPFERCDQEGIDAVNDGRRSGDIATGALIAGGALTLGGILLYALAPSSSDPPISGAFVAPEIGEIYGMSVHASW